MKKVLFIDNVHIDRITYPRFRYILPHLKGHLETELIEVGLEEEAGLGKLISRSFKFDAVFVRNLFKPFLVRSIRTLCERTVVELDIPHAPDLEEEDGKKWKHVLAAAKGGKYVLLQGATHLRVVRRKVLNAGLFPPLAPEPMRKPELERKMGDEDALVVLCEGPHSLMKDIEVFSRSLAGAKAAFGNFLLHVRSDFFVSPGKEVKVYFERCDTPYTSASHLSPEIFIYPVLRENGDYYGTSPYVLNALAQSLPCLVPPTEIDRRIFRDGENLFVFNTPGELEEKLRHLLENPSVRAELGERGRKTWEENFHPSRVAPFYLSLIEKMWEAAR